MIRSAVLVLAAIALLSTPAPAYTAVGGGKGMFRVQDALVDEPGLNITLHIVGRRISDSLGRVYVGDLVAPSLHYIPYSSRFFGAEVFASWGGIFQYADAERWSGSKYRMGLHDLRAGGKLSIPYLPVLKLGGTAAYTPKLRDFTQFYLDPDAGLPYDNAEPLSWSALATLRFQDLAASAPNLMFNYGAAAGRTVYGAGLELAATGFALFAEAQSLQPELGSTGPLDIDNGQLRLTPGVRVGPSSGSAFNLAYTFGWGTGVANSVNLGFNIATPFFRRVPPQLGTITGVVRNASTDAPLAATLTFPDNPKLAPVATDPNTGVFMVKNVPAGDVTVRAEAEGFMASALPVHVDAGKTGTYDFPLRALVTYGVIAGSVHDATTGRPLKASVEFPGSELKAIESDGSTGAFRVDDVPVGPYTLAVAADGYFSSTQTISVTENGVANPAFLLSPTTVKSVVTGQVTDRGTNAALAAKVVFKDPTSGTVVTEVNTDPTTGVFVANLPVATYAVTAQAEGYIDQSAAVAAEKDRTAKQDFALVKPGTKVTLKNIYFDYNKATIKMPQSKEALDGAAKILTDNPTIRVEIQGHTDSDGSDAYNQRLSEQRAMSVVSYLVQNYGIAMTRLTAVGYGEAQPVAGNDTPEGKALNRRVEFVVLGE